MGNLRQKKTDEEWAELMLHARAVKDQPPVETINHPQHYVPTDGTYEAIKVIDAWELDFALGNVVKYVARAGKKGNPLEDLKKAAWYLNNEIKKRKSRNG